MKSLTLANGVKRKILVISICFGLSSVASANNWMKLLQLSDESRLRAEQARAPTVPIVGPISSEFGPRVHPVSGKNQTHKGIDVAAAHGEPFVAIATGLVVEAEHKPGFGNTILIDHENGLTSRYAHASELTVTVGEYVDKNQLIGRVGQTGLATGPHLHLEVHLDGKPVDPLTLLSLTQNTQYSEMASAQTTATKTTVHQSDVSVQRTATAPLTESFDAQVAQASQRVEPDKPNETDLAVGTYVNTNRSMWSIAKQLSKELQYPSLKSIIDILVETNPRSFPTSDANYRLASVPLFIPENEVFDALLPEVVLTEDPVWLISQKLKKRYDTSASIYQIMYSLKSKNPEAFVENDINRRLASLPLKLTTPEEFLEISHTQAYATFKRETQT